MKRLFLVFCFCTAIFAGARGQEKSEKINLSMDVASNFIWRGLAVNTTPVMQSTVAFLPESRFSFGVWASAPFSADGGAQPCGMNLFFNVQLSRFLTLNVTDYFVYGSGSADYFNLKKDETGHFFDVKLIFDSEDFPLKAMVTPIFAGSDLNDKGKNNFSTYIELAYKKSGKHVNWGIFTGAVPMASDMYGIDGANVVNVGFNVSKSFQINPNWSMPLWMKFSVNPAGRTAYLTAGISLF